MEFRQHVGVLLLLIVVSYLSYIWERRWKTGTPIPAPILSGLILWILFEVVYWVFELLIIIK